MATNIEIDQNLVRKAMKLGGSRTKREVVNKALEEYVQRREQLRVLDLFGTVEYDPDHDYKRQRKRK
ncbi:MAG: type II toxin-antitoxin system VapB family antitoxin [Puniceicoccaceae bacterium]